MLLDVARGTLAESAGRSRSIECRRREMREKREANLLTPEVAILIQKYQIDSTSRLGGAMIGGN
jgi:hypothetical protein